MRDPQNITLKFTAQALDYIIQVVRQRPHAECDPLIKDIEAQLNRQNELQLPVINQIAEQAPTAPVQ